MKIAIIINKLFENLEQNEQKKIKHIQVEKEKLIQNKEVLPVDSMDLEGAEILAKRRFEDKQALQQLLEDEKELKDTVKEIKNLINNHDLEGIEKKIAVSTIYMFQSPYLVMGYVLVNALKSNIEFDEKTDNFPNFIKNRIKSIWEIRISELMLFLQENTQFDQIQKKYADLLCGIERDSKERLKIIQTGIFCDDNGVLKTGIHLSLFTALKSLLTEAQASITSELEFISAFDTIWSQILLDLNKESDQSWLDKLTAGFEQNNNQQSDKQECKKIKLSNQSDTQWSGEKKSKKESKAEISSEESSENEEKNTPNLNVK